MYNVFINYALHYITTNGFFTVTNINIIRNKLCVLSLIVKFGSTDVIISDLFVSLTDSINNSFLYYWVIGFPEK